MTDKKTCSAFSKCSETTSSWFFLFIGVIATISIRLVNFVIDFSVVWAKASWYIGIAGFTVYFIYKYNQHNSLQKELKRLKLLDKLTCKETLADSDYDTLKNILCQLGSRNSAINYFVIFLSSGIALLVGIYQDFIIR